MKSVQSLPLLLRHCMVPLMEEILHQLIGSLSHYFQGFIHPRWCRISSINSRNKKKWSFLIEFAFVIQESYSTTTKSLSGFRLLVCWKKMIQLQQYSYILYIFIENMKIGWMVHDGFIRSMMFLPSTNHLTHQLSSCAMSQCGWGLHGIISHGHVSLASQVHLASCWTGAKSWKSKLISDAKNQVSESKGTSKSHVQHPTQKNVTCPVRIRKRLLALSPSRKRWHPGWRQITGELQRINLKPQTYHGFFLLGVSVSKRLAHRSVWLS